MGSAGDPSGWAASSRALRRDATTWEEVDLPRREYAAERGGGGWAPIGVSTWVAPSLRPGKGGGASRGSPEQPQKRASASPVPP